MPCKCYCEVPIAQEITGIPEEGYNPFFFSEGGDALLFRFTDASFTRVLSALWNGAMMAYGNQAHQVLWDFLVNVEYPLPICEAITDCILNTPSVMDAIVQKLIENDTFNTYITERVSSLTIEGATSELFAGDCDNSVVAGRVIQIVDSMDGINTDFLEIVEVGTNDEERVAAIIGAIPVLEMTPVDEVISLVQTFLEDFTENYAAAVTPTWKLEVCEDLYCIALENEDCALTYEDLLAYFSDRVGTTITISSVLSNVFSFIVNGDFSTDDLIASGMYLIQLSFVLAGRDFNGMNLPTIGALARDASPSSAWEDWNECGTPPIEGDWAIEPGYAGLTLEQSGKITAQTPTSVTFSTDQSRDGEYRIVAQYNSFGTPVTIVTSSNPGSILAKYHGVGSSLFGGTLANSQLVASDQLNYLYFTHTAPFTLYLTFTT